MNYSAISSDDHLQEPVTLWQDRLPAALKDRGPRLVELPNGGHAFQLGNIAPKPLDILVAAGQTLEQKREKVPARWENVRPGFWKPVERLADMDKDGVWASVLYPNMVLDIMMNQVTLDLDLRLPVIQVFNDHLNEFCTTNPDRLIGVGMLPSHDPAVAVKEIERVAGMGRNIKGMMIPVKPDLSDWIDPVWDPLWAAAAGANLPLSLHGGKPRWQPPRAELLKMRNGMNMYLHTGYLSVIEGLSNIAWNGSFDRYPNLKVITVEGDIGWMPHWKERGARLFRKFAVDSVKRGPDAWFGTNIFATFEEDPMGIRLLDVIGEGTLMWASDYPHANSSFPNSVKVIEDSLGGLPPATRRKLTWDNVAKLYGLKLPPGVH